MADEMKLEDLKKLINEGVEYSNDKNNRSYLFSSFKRTVSGWNSDFKKLEKEKNSDKKVKLEGKLIDKMQKEAKKYLDEVKNSVDGQIVRNPEAYRKITKLQKTLESIKPKLETLFTEAKEAKGTVEKAVNYYNETLIKQLPKKQIDIDIDNYINNPNDVNDSKIKNLIAAEELSSVITCYKKIKKKHSNCESFTEWLKTEWHYLKKFESLSATRLRIYQSHYSFIDHSDTCTKSEQNATNLKNFIDNIPSDIKNKFAQKVSVFAGFSTSTVFASSAALLSLAFPPLAAAAATMAVGMAISATIAGISALITYRKPLKKEVYDSLKYAQKRIEQLTSLRKGTKELNKNKVEYMNTVSNLK